MRALLGLAALALLVWLLVVAALWAWDREEIISREQVEAFTGGE